MSERGAHLPAADGELWALVEALVADSATPAQRDRLEARLRADLAARQFYVAFLDQHAQLQWRTRGESAQLAPPPGRARRPRRPFGWPLSAAVAACVAVAAGLLVVALLPRHGPDEGEPPDLPDMPSGSVAVLIDNANTVWEEGTAPAGAGPALPPGRLKLKSGVVGVAFHGGAELQLEGPADLEVRGPDQAFLHRGKLLALVPEGAPAFRAGMPGLAVTAFCGECGLLREAGRTEAHVFEGRAEANLAARPAGPGAALAEKSGARLDAGRRALTPVPLDERAFARLRPQVRVADATVRGGQFAGRNFGTADRLVVKNSIADYTWDTYLRFDLSGVRGEVAAAAVRLVPVHVGQPLENAVALVADNRWGEKALTWDNKPPSGPAFARWTVVEGGPVEFDVTGPVRAALAGDKKLSLRVFAPVRKRGASFVEYGSRRGEAAARPRLLLTTVP